MGYTIVEKGCLDRDMCKYLGLRYFGKNSPHFARLEKSVDGGVTKEIVVVGTCDDVSVVGAVTEFPTTLLMNFIAADGFYSLYPGLTSEGQGYLNPPVDIVPNIDSVLALKLLKDEYFDLVSDPIESIGGHRCGVHPYCPSAPRLFPGPPQFLADFHGIRTCYCNGSWLPSVFWTLRSASARGTELGPFRDVSSDENGVHAACGKETGMSIDRR